MIDIGKKEIEIKCSKCGNDIVITLNQAANEDTIKCEKCNSNIKLTDVDGSARKSIDDLNDLLDFSDL